MKMPRIDQFITGIPTLTDVVPFSQGTNTRKALLSEFKNLFTSDINTSLSERMQDILSITKDIQGKKIKLIGDSITAGVGGTGYSLSTTLIYDSYYQAKTTGHCWANSLKTFLEGTYGCTVNNYGISGFTSYQANLNVDNLVDETDDIVIYMLGTNDRTDTNGLTYLTNAMNTFYNKVVKTYGNKIIFMSNIPALQADEDTRTYHMDRIDAQIMLNASKFGIQYISLYKLFTDYCTSRNVTLTDIYNGLVHPNDSGYDIMFYLILNSLGLGNKDPYSNTQVVEQDGWISATAEGTFTCDIKYRITNKVVEVKGVFNGITAVNTLGITLPVGYRPSAGFYILSPSTNSNYARWLVGADGKITLQAISSDTALGSTSWIPFHTTFTID
jgi:lysophospholipase L1-like esterase